MLQLFAEKSDINKYLYKSSKSFKQECWKAIDFYLKVEYMLLFNYVSLLMVLSVFGFTW